MSSNAEWVIAVANSVLAVTIVVFGLQLRNDVKHIKADHERSRREKAIDLLEMYATKVHENSPGLRFSTKLLSQLNENNYKAIWNCDPFEVEEKHKYLIIGALECDINKLNLKIEFGRIFLRRRELLVIRSQLVGYLNVLEVVATAWKHNVADREIIEDEFDRLIIQQDGLRKFCDAGVFGQPSFRELYGSILERKKRSNGKPKVA
ncbi:MAG: hypothetical protein Q7K29_07560 [Thermoleophilia bacterium]|nr:hypothetical protein [Thermoleophilia bacterium]